MELSRGYSACSFIHSSIHSVTVNGVPAVPGSVPVLWEVSVP